VAELSRLIIRPWSDSAFRVLALSLFVAALSLSTMLLLRSELDARFDQRGAEMLGGDIELDGARGEDPAQAQLLSDYEISRNVRFQSVLVHNDERLLVGVKAVDAHWPLYGQVQVADGRFANSYTLAHGPAVGEAWVAEQVLDRLQLNVGDSVSIGSLALPIKRVVRQEPDQGAGFYGMTPPGLMHHDELAATGILREGSPPNFEVLGATGPLSKS